MFHKVLIANRGEISGSLLFVRLVNLASRRLQCILLLIKRALHTLLADEAVCIGPAKSTESYLNMGAVLSAAVLTGRSYPSWFWIFK